MVAWGSYHDEIEDWETHAQIFTEDGEKSEDYIMVGTEMAFFYPSVVPLEEDEFIVLWEP